MFSYTTNHTQSTTMKTTMLMHNIQVQYYANLNDDQFLIIYANVDCMTKQIDTWSR